MHRRFLAAEICKHVEFASTQTIVSKNATGWDCTNCCAIQHGLWHCKLIQMCKIIKRKEFARQPRNRNKPKERTVVVENAYILQQKHSLLSSKRNAYYPAKNQRACQRKCWESNPSRRARCQTGSKHSQR